MLFWHTFWLMRLWCAVVLGTWIIVRRQGPEALPFRLYRETILLTTVALVLFLFIPDLFRQEWVRWRPRSVGPEDVAAVSVAEAKRQLIWQDLPKPAEREFVRRLNGAELHYQGFDGAIKRYEIQMLMKSGDQFLFAAHVPESNPKAVCLEFRAFLTMSALIVPDARKWIEQAAP